jgi:hypothetical protein
MDVSRRLVSSPLSRPDLSITRNIDVYISLLDWTCYDSDVSRASDVTVSAYLRTAPGHDRQDMGNDLLISSVTFSPNIQAKVIHPFPKPCSSQ